MKAIKSVAVIFTISLMAITSVCADYLWKEDFESGLDNWEMMLGDWEIDEEGGNHYLVTPFDKLKI